VIQTNLKEILEGHGDMSIYRLSQLTGLSEITITKFLKGEGKGVHYNTLNNICKILDCTPGDLLTYINDSVKGDQQDS
jgi:putative transcriptional regulator